MSRLLAQRLVGVLTDVPLVRNSQESALQGGMSGFMLHASDFSIEIEISGCGASCLLAHGPLFVSPKSFAKNPLENFAGTAFRQFGI